MEEKATQAEEASRAQRSLTLDADLAECDSRQTRLRAWEEELEKKDAAMQQHAAEMDLLRREVDLDES